MPTSALPLISRARSDSGDVAPVLPDQLRSCIQEVLINIRSKEPVSESTILVL